MWASLAAKLTLLDISATGLRLCGRRSTDEAVVGTEIVRSVGRFVGLEEPPTISTSHLHLAEILGTRLTWREAEDAAPVRMETSDGYLICLQRRSLPPIPYWVDGKPAETINIRAGQFLLLDMNNEHASVTRGTVDCVSMYLTSDALKRFHLENNLRSAPLRTENGFAFNDDIIKYLGECIAPLFERSDQASQLFADHVSMALMAHLSNVYAERPILLPVMRGGLAHWQERRAKEMLMSNLDGRVGLEELASACGISRSHFARAFKVTTGRSPLNWLLLQRVERAKNLLLNSTLPLDQVALHSGFADQSHFTKGFTKVVGMTPGLWRRTRRL